MLLSVGLGGLLSALCLFLWKKEDFRPFSAAALVELAQLPLLCLLLFRGRADAVMSAAPGAAAAILTLGLGLACLLRPAEGDGLPCAARVSLSAAAAACGFLADGTLEGGEAGLLLLLLLSSAWEGLRGGRIRIVLPSLLRRGAGLAAACAGFTLLGVSALDLVLTRGLPAARASYVLLPLLCAAPATISALHSASTGRREEAALTLYHAAAMKLCLWLPLSALMGQKWELTQNLQVQYLPFLGIAAVAACFPAAAGRRTFRPQGIALLFLAGAYGVLTWIA